MIKDPLVFHGNYYKAARIITVILLASLTFYTIVLFFNTFAREQMEIFFYLFPSFILAILFFLMYNHEMLSGVLFIFVSFGFLLIYQVNIAIAVFGLLILIGVLLLVDFRNTHQKNEGG